MDRKKIDCLSQLFASLGGEIIAEDNTFYLKSSCKKGLILLNENGIGYDELSIGYALRLYQYLEVKIFTYTDVEQFFQPEDLSSELIIFSVGGEYCVYSPDQIEFSDGSDMGFKNKCNNLLVYYKLFNYLSNENGSDHHNDGAREFIFYTSISGIVKLRFDVIPDISDNYDYSQNINELIELVRNLVYKPFFINAIYLLSGQTGTFHFSELIEKSEELLLITKRDYELAARKFDFETFKKSLYKEKEKYFSNVREIVNKIFSQVISIPISIGATVFSTYKVSDDKLMLTLVLFTFLIYTYLYIKFQLIYKSDIMEIQTDFQRDFSNIRLNSGMPLVDIELEEEKVKSKIKISLNVIRTVITIVVILTIIVTVFILYELLYKTPISISNDNNGVPYVLFNFNF